MPFKALFMAHAPDADKDRHRSLIDTGLYRLSTVIVRNQKEAVEVCREFVEKEAIDAVLLCPGFTNSDVAELQKVAGPGVSVSVSRGDGPGNRIALEAMRRAGYPIK